ncbi:MAG TPA: alpha/beta fold hydrolase, partial [Candidatus Saccharimonadia bacterium]|nr:alpha/beta fold hydrolase [Candidatus Saccharimonadia bacterium]
MHRSTGLFAGAALAACMLVAAPDAAARKLGTLEFEPCSLAPEGLALTVAAQCATLSVPQDRKAPDGRRIELAIAWIPNDEGKVADDPVFMLAGGPGQAARDSYPLLHGAFAEIRRTRHVILVDQRGTGGSNRLSCKDPRGDNAFSGDDALDVTASVAFAKTCLSQFDADVRHYTTTDAVADLDDVREAIGAEAIDLVGISYGTRVAQQYARRHPDRTRSVVLDGVVPNTLVLGAEHAKNLEAALDAHFARCTAEPKCVERFGSPRANLDALLAKARAEPQLVRYRDPQSNAPREDRFDAATLAAVVRLYAYAPTTGALLPLALHEAAQGRPEELLAQARMLTSLVGESIMHGMQLSVICSEDASRLGADAADAATTLGTVLVDLLLAQCAVWP